MSPKSADNKHNWARLDSFKTRLFREDGMTKMMICKMVKGEPAQTHPLMDTEHARKYLEDSFLMATPAKQSTHLIIFGQVTSQSPLNISYECFRLLLGRICAFPALLQSMTRFAGGVVPTHESWGAFDATTQTTTTGPKVFEICALFKYVALNRRKNDPIPWSVRKMMLYQKYDGLNEREVVLLVRASEDMLTLTQEKITEYSDGGMEGHHWTRIPMLICSVLNANWADYLEHIERKLWTLANSTSFTNPFNPNSDDYDIDLEQGDQFDSLKAGHYWEGLLIRASHALESNIGVLKALSTEASRRRVMEHPSHDALNILFADVVSKAERESQLLLIQISSIRARLGVSLTMIRDCINARAAHHTALEASYMHDVSARSLREARTVRVIAIVTLIFLPGTFTATFFGMQYVRTESSDRALKVSIEPELLLYLAITLPLTALTLFGWWLGDQLQIGQRRWWLRPLSRLHMNWRPLNRYFKFKSNMRKH